MFDLDNTLLGGDSDFEWAEFLIEVGALDRELHRARNQKFYENYQAGSLDILAFLEFQLKPLSAHPRAQLDAWHTMYMEHKVRPMMLPKARALVKRHQDNGDLTLIITATNSFVTGPIASEFGVEHLIATIPEEVNGQFTGRVCGLPSFKEGKVTRLKQWLEARGENLESFEASWFYSDSHNDLPLLKLVDHQVAVDADQQLTQYAEAQGWPRISLR